MNTSQSDSLLFLPNGYIDSPSSLLLEHGSDSRTPADGFPFGWDGQSAGTSTNSITSSVSLSSLEEFRFGSQSSSSSSLMEHRSQVSSSSDGDSEGTSSSSFCSGNAPAFSFTPPGHPSLNRSYSSTSASTKATTPLSRSLSSSRPSSKPLLHLPIPAHNGPVPPSLVARRGSLPATGAVPFQNTASGPSPLSSRRGSNGPPPAPSAWSWNPRGSELQGIPSPLRMEYNSNELALIDDDRDDDVTMDDLAEPGGRRFEGSPRRVNASPSPLGGTRSTGYNGNVSRGKPGSPYGRGGGASRKMSLPTHFASQTTHSYTSTTTTTSTTSAANKFFLSQAGMSSNSVTPRANFALGVPPNGTQTPLSPESPTTHLQPIPPHRSQQQQQYQQSHQQQIKQPSLPPTSLLHQTKPGATGYPFPPQQKPQTPPATPRTNLSALPSQSSSSSSTKGNKASASATPPPAPSGPSTLSVALLDGHELNQLFESRYTLISSLGSGGYGFVCVASDHASGKEVAVKFILASKVPSHAWVAYAGGGEEGDGMPEVGGKVPMECEVLRRVRHWGVVAGLGVYYDGKFFYLVQELHGDPWAPSTPGTPSASAQGSPSVVMPPLPTIGLGPPSPFAPSFALPASPYVGPSQSLPPTSPVTPIRPSINMERRGSCDLFECVERHKKFGEARARMIFKQIVETVSYLSRIGIYHRDIKDENLVIDRDYRVKLIDFGSAVWESPSSPSSSSSNSPHPHHPGSSLIKYKDFFGTTAYASPEIITGHSYYASEAEVWSLGILLCILVTGESPFASPKEAQIGRRTERKGGGGGRGMSRELGDLVDRCLEVSPERRITIEEMRGHRWLSGH